MYYFGAIETIKFCRRGNAVCADIFSKQIISDFQISRKRNGLGYLIKTVAGLSDDSTYFFFAILECGEIGKPMIEDHTGEGMINAIVDVIENLPVSSGFADDFGDQRCRGCRDESSGFRYNLDIRGEESLTFGINETRQAFKFGNLSIIGHGKTSADVDNLQIISFPIGIIEYFRCDGKRCRIIVKICALASHMKTQPFNHETGIVCLTYKFLGISRLRSKFGTHLNLRT